jgi:hypothetical protein
MFCSLRGIINYQLSPINYLIGFSGKILKFESTENNSSNASSRFRTPTTRMPNNFSSPFLFDAGKISFFKAVRPRFAD